MATFATPARSIAVITLVAGQRGRDHWSEDAATAVAAGM